eukprot:TRINITY_DN49607_c0_g1_i1.p1 TRINITY_DN49607_c0_g1~~TRINITY_DN49607_c0_g1_i1.p1  ORF type:complete len:306 (+),score=58.54 TRINITY_DN49607_c0_g1_i1:59-976(+)
MQLDAKEQGNKSMSKGPLEPIREVHDDGSSPSTLHAVLLLLVCIVCTLASSSHLTRVWSESTDSVSGNNTIAWKSSAPSVREPFAATARDTMHDLPTQNIKDFDHLETMRKALQKKWKTIGRSLQVGDTGSATHKPSRLLRAQKSAAAVADKQMLFLERDKIKTEKRLLKKQRSSLRRESFLVYDQAQMNKRAAQAYKRKDRIEMLKYADSERNIEAKQRHEAERMDTLMAIQQRTSNEFAEGIVGNIKGAEALSPREWAQHEKAELAHFNMIKKLKAIKKRWDILEEQRLNATLDAKRLLQRTQ